VRYKTIIIVILFILFILCSSFSIPGEFDFFHVKKIWTITIHSLNNVLVFSTPFIPDDILADHIYGFYSINCHQLPDHSFKLNGRQLPLCARCTGITLGQLIGEVTCIIPDNLNPYKEFQLEKSIIYCLAVSALFFPLVIDGSVQYFTVYESNNMMRLATGMLYGIAMTSLMDELVRILDYYI
jgi:uncharacterized membrane protein